MLAIPFCDMLAYLLFHALGVLLVLCVLLVEALELAELALACAHLTLPADVVGAADVAVVRVQHGVYLSILREGLRARLLRTALLFAILLGC